MERRRQGYGGQVRWRQSNPLKNIVNRNFTKRFYLTKLFNVIFYIIELAVIGGCLLLKWESRYG